MKRYWSSLLGQSLNWPALVAWASGMALALGLWLTDTIHLFFLFLPVYILTSLVYLVLAATAGARNGALEEAGSRPDRAEGFTGAVSSVPDGDGGPSSRWQNSTVSRLCCFTALAALGACIVMPGVVYFSNYGSYEENMEWFKGWLIVPTLVYFVTGSIWQITKKKERS